MSQEQDNQRPGFWGSTLGKLKTALSRTKDAVVDSIVDKGTDVGNAAVNDAGNNAGGVGGTVNSNVNTGANASPYVNNEPELQALAAIAGSQMLGQPNSQLPPMPSPVPAPSAPPAPAVPPRKIDDEYLEDLEEKLIRADLGVGTAQAMVEDLRKEAKSKGLTSRDVEGFLKREFENVLRNAPSPALKYVPGKLNIYFVVGVNGTGKTTSIGKLSWRFKSEGKRVLMAAADTFRAAAETQLEIWAERAGVDIVRLPDGSDPGAVVFHAIQKAKAENYDCLVIDTAGRLHNKVNLMAELKKVRSVIEKNADNCPLEALLVLDASTGQNGLQQAKVFTEASPLTGVILTKLDGSAKGGVIFSIARDLKIPVKLIGLGEKIDELRDFEPEVFIQALF